MNKNYENLPNITMEAMDEDDAINAKNPTNNLTLSKFNAKNYLNTKLDNEKNEKSKELKIRLLPIDSKSSTPFKKIYVHQVKVPKEVAKSGYKSYICIEKTEGVDHEIYGNKCPFCELNREAYKKSVEATNPVDKKRYQDTSLANLAKEACVIRCIERGAEDDGPKFWKFNIKLDKTDPKNLIKKLYKTRLDESREDGEEENILDIYKGKDLKVTIELADSKTENESDKKNKTSITIIDCGKNKPLSDNNDLINKWINDPKKWSDVFTIKPYDYLAVIINGGIPWFDKVNHNWISKDEFDRINDSKVKEIDEKISNSENTLKSDDSVMSSVVIDDEDYIPHFDEEHLPF